jgi:hypothetical protein
MQISENPKPIPADVREKLENYRTQLLSAGFLEPTRHHSADWHWYFHRPDTDLTAFAVNLHGKDGWLEVTYGLASTAFTRMAGDENALNWYGLSDPDITLRENFLVCDDSDAETLAAQIAAFFSRYRGTKKDALLDLAREKRKAYIAQFAALKPLGFKKKATTWTRPLDSFELIFNLQKSAYADEYYYNIRFQPVGSRDYRRCHESRISPGTLDWQALTARELDFFLTRTLLPTLQKFLETPLPELGRDPKIWKCCHCDHLLCPRCWVEKNVWEAK